MADFLGGGGLTSLAMGKNTSTSLVEQSRGLHWNFKVFSSLSFLIQENTLQFCHLILEIFYLNEQEGISSVHSGQRPLWF